MDTVILNTHTTHDYSMLQYMKTDAIRIMNNARHLRCENKPILRLRDLGDEMKNPTPSTMIN